MLTITNVAQLPWELIEEICLFAAAQDQFTATQICLTSRALWKITEPMLYRHPRLNGTLQLARFIATLAATSRFNSFINEMTLEDTSFNESEAKMTSDWYATWDKIQHTVNHLIKHYHLRVLALSQSACFRLSSLVGGDAIICPYNDPDQTFLGHLILLDCQCTRAFSQIIGNIKKLTYYGCGHNFHLWILQCMQHNPGLSHLSGKGPSDINIMVGSDGLDEWVLHSKLWKFSPLGACSIIPTEEGGILPNDATIRFNVHRRAPGMKLRVEKEFSEQNLSDIKIGVWGDISDRNQKEAEERSRRRFEWMDEEIAGMKEETILVNPTLEEQRKWNVGVVAVYPHINSHFKNLSMHKGVPQSIKRWDGRDEEWCNCKSSPYSFRI